MSPIFDLRTPANVIHRSVALLDEGFAPHRMDNIRSYVESLDDASL